MNQIDASVTIEAPAERTWDVLSDLTAMADYMPGATSVRLVSDHATGPGATRHCVFDDGVELTERVRDWDDGARTYTLETTEFKKVPMRSNVVTFAVSGDGSGSKVTQVMRYEMKGGPLAGLLERLAAGKMNKALSTALAGLKEHVER